MAQIYHQSQEELHQLLISADFKINRAAMVRFGVVWGLMVVTALPEKG